MNWLQHAPFFTRFGSVNRRQRVSFGIVLVSIFLLLLLIVSRVYITSSSHQISEDKSWQVSVMYNRGTQAVRVKQIKLVPLHTRVDDRPAQYSIYRLVVLDKKRNQIYGMHVPISEQVLVDYMSNTPEVASSAAVMPQDIPTELFVPYAPDAMVIQMLRNSIPVLELQLPQHLSFQIPQTSIANAAGSNAACGPLHVVFINDNYGSQAEFQADVQTLKQLYNSTPPYDTSPSIFDFKEIDTPQNYQCGNDLLSCYLVRMQGPPQSAVLQQFPGAQKVVVVTNSPTADVQGIGGVTDIGGEIVLYSNYPYQGRKFGAASHEFLGHSVGYLHDRYVINQQFAASKGIPTYGTLLPGEPRNNCTDNPSGESGWPQGAYQGCANHTNYAPYPLTCDWRTQGGPADFGGNSSTVMSAVGCATGPSFDPVEVSWMKTHIVPLYQSSCPQPTQQPTTGVTIAQNASPTTGISLPITGSHSIRIIAFVDTNNNGIQDNAEQGYSGVIATLQGPLSTTIQTDSTGLAVIPDVPNGIYTMNAHIAGAAPLTTNFTVNDQTQAIILGIPIHLAPAGTQVPGTTTIPTPRPTIGGIVYLTPTPFLPGTTATSVPTQTLVPTIISSNQDQSNATDNTDASSTPQVYYSCVPDPKCVTGKQNLQLCALTCTQDPTPQPTILTQLPVPSTCPPGTHVGPGNDEFCSPDAIPSPSLSPSPQPQTQNPISYPPLSQAPSQRNIDNTSNPLQQQCEQNDIAGNGGPSKPVVYLYPESPQYIDVSVKQSDHLSISIPFYDKNGWRNVLAYPDGTLLYKNQKYNELFYELKEPVTINLRQGIIIPKNQLSEKLFFYATKLGLRTAEANEFRDWWLPRLTQKKGNFVLFSLFGKEEKEQLDSITISPKPDTFISFLAYFKMLDAPIIIDPLLFPDVPKRSGFTAVEWGGVSEDM